MFKRLQITFIIVFFVLHSLGEAQALDKSYFIGTWKGEGRIIVAWCKQKQLPFDLQVHPDGTVSGRIGDAHIKQGTMKHNNFIYRLIGNKKFVINAELSGNLVEGENIKRYSIRVFLDLEKPFMTESFHASANKFRDKKNPAILDFNKLLLIGGFHTSGSKFGDKEKMILSGTGLKLVKTI